MPYDLSTAVKDPDFVSASVADKIAFLSAHDSDFASASPKDQGAYLSHIMGFDSPTQFEKDNPVPSAYEREANEFLLGAASGASGLPETERPVASAISGVTQPLSTGDVAGQAILGPAYGVAKGLYQAGKQILAPSGQGEDAALERAHGVGTLVGAAAPAVVGEAVSGVPGARGAIGDAIHTPQGELTPGAQLGSKLVGGAAGTAVGEVVGHPYAGGVLGYKAGPFLLDKMFPESPETVAAREDFLNAKTITEAHEAAIKENALKDARAARAKAVEDRKQAQAAKQAEKQKTADEKKAAASAPPPSPFPGATPTNVPVGNAPLPAAPAELSQLANPTPFKQGPQFVSKFAAPEPSRIVSPESPAPHVEGSYWSFNEGALRRAVLGGDRAAAIVYKQRFGQLPPGASYLSDIGSNPNRGLYVSQK